jgi:hypothetical protein
LEIVGQSLHQRPGKREVEKVFVFALAKTDSLVSPVHLIQTQTGNLTGTHPQGGGQESASKIPFPPRLLSVDAIEQMQNLFWFENPGSASQTVLARGDQSGRPVPVHSSPAEQITKEATQNLLDPLNAKDISGGLLADELVQVIDFQLLEVVDLVVVKKVIKTSAEEFHLEEGIDSQTPMLLTKIEVLTGFRKEVLSPHGLFERKPVSLQMSHGSCPAEKSPQTVLQADVVGGFKALFAAESVTAFGPGMILQPVVDELHHLLRSELLESSQSSTLDELSEAAQVSETTADTLWRIAMNVEVGLILSDPGAQLGALFFFHGFPGSGKPSSSCRLFHCEELGLFDRELKPSLGPGL